MSLVIPIFVRGVEEGGGFMEFPGGGGKWKRESIQILDLQRLASPLPLKNSTTFKAYPEEFYRSSTWRKELGVGVGGRGCSMLNAKSKIQVSQKFTGEVTMR